MRNFTTTVACAICTTEFVRKNSRSKYCSDKCGLIGERRVENARRARVGRPYDDPLKEQARKSVSHELRAGRMFRPAACERCSLKTKELHAHHYNGYEQPHWLDVLWLCAKCHKREHMALAA